MPLPTCLDVQTEIGTFRFILSEETFSRLKQDPHFQLPDLAIELLERLKKIVTSVRFKYLNLSRRTLLEMVYPAFILSVENPIDNHQIELEVSLPIGNFLSFDPSDFAGLVMQEFGSELRKKIKPRKEPLDSPPYIGDLEPRWLVDLALAFGVLAILPAGAGTDY